MDCPTSVTVTAFSEMVGKSSSNSRKAASLRQVAEEVGVSRMTVSRAFKKDSSIKAELREKILKTASDLGYAPDKMVSELMTRFASRRPIHYQETFAALWWPERWAGVNSNHGFDADIYDGLQEGSKIHGRGIDHFVLNPEMTPQVIMEILEARNIQGVIITPPTSSEARVPQLEWKNLSSVFVGSSLREPAFHRSQTSHYNAMSQALERLQQSGFSRPCLLLRSDLEMRMLRAYSAAFLAWDHPAEHIWQPPQREADGLSSWLQKVNPDVIIADSDPWFELIPKAVRERGFLSLGVHDRSGSISGIYQNTAQMARGAIDLLVRARLSHETGIPEAPILLLTSGVWIEGQTLPARPLPV
ncbi:LacI family DNA-binding transcriptional regulator [Puniceicoccus vermicola]|uniref:LacI family DNA-binding transcriptional regulator n=1 Tax=Puniceicoccus vermicola TaxID=388746 RepID=A0A7X1E4J6_9BACT|nr:LacI family DNA-binding transcriptional regulator [Puniceicoccus vermicola]MBC2602211.1 LacI family DNA-binding transcriptional regulator [Puniceicoccus vermicola]